MMGTLGGGIISCHLPRLNPKPDKVLNSYLIIDMEHKVPTSNDGLHEEITKF